VPDNRELSGTLFVRYAESREQRKCNFGNFSGVWKFGNFEKDTYLAGLNS
jgi:hypothetical protein